MLALCHRECERQHEGITALGATESLLNIFLRLQNYLAIRPDFVLSRGQILCRLALIQCAAKL